uniref:Ig-like domain-containing protein n=1 Tax=Neolamprologus brichardi TaxID=32507 RepID=A0A3Q4HYN7_NEOBR
MSACFLLLYVFLFAGVSGVTVLTQKPPVVSVRKGETATMDCNLGTVTYYVYWYKQIPGGVPQHVLRFHHSQRFSSDRFNSKSSSNIDYQFIIKRAETGDSAVYYCQTYDDSASAHVSQ